MVYSPAKPKAKYPNRQVKLKYGLGCDKWPDCFSCPFPASCHYVRHTKETSSQRFVYTDGLDYFPTLEEMQKSGMAI